MFFDTTVDEQLRQKYANTGVSSSTATTDPPAVGHELVKGQKDRLEFIKGWSGQPWKAKGPEELKKGLIRNPIPPALTSGHVSFLVIPEPFPPCTMFNGVDADLIFVDYGRGD